MAVSKRQVSVNGDTAQINAMAAGDRIAYEVVDERGQRDADKCHCDGQPGGSDAGDAGRVQDRDSKL